LGAGCPCQLAEFAVSFARGGNDGQKGMGLIMLILIGAAPTAYALKACKLILIQDDSTPVGATKDLSASPHNDRQAQRNQNRAQRPVMPRDAAPTLRQANDKGSYLKSKTPNNMNEWQRNYARYCDLAQNTNDDAVARENYWQHAEHFLRMINGSSI
jgi:phosphate/sulfate permease